MQTVYFKGTPCHTYGNTPKGGEKAPCFNLVTSDLKEIGCMDYEGKTVVLNIFPSLDTPVCAMSVRKFNKEAAEFPNVAIICVSMDLPFAEARFCSAEGIDKVTVASAFRSPLFAQKFGVQLVDGPLAGLLTRAVFVLDGQRNVLFADVVNEITEEPDYKGAIDVLEQIKKGAEK